MFDKLAKIEARYEEIERQLGASDAAADRERFTALTREHSELSPLVATFRERQRVGAELEEARALGADPDPEMRVAAESEIASLAPRIETLDADLRELLIPRDPLDDRSAILEIRAGTGGAEAGLFAADLMRMYSRFAETQGWKLESLSFSTHAMGGLKEAITLVKGRDAYGKLKYEGGVHRVQRVPETEAQGRIHTSACTVAVLPEVEPLDLKVDEKELRVDVFRSSGPGGQSVNTTDSAVRITHLPSGLVVSCQDEKSQHKNKAKAMKILMSRLFDLEQAKRHAEQAADRKAMVGSGDRSERIRTYNFPQGRVTDHRIGLTLYSLDRFIDGDIAEVITALRNHYQAEALQRENEARP
jgi:peptide chain release factor 1